MELTRGLPADDLDAWDPEYIRRTLSIIGRFFRTYFRGEVAGHLTCEEDVPIVPVVSIGGQDTALFVARGERAARLIDLRERFGADPDPDEVYGSVTAEMQDALSDLAGDRTAPVVG